MMLKLKNVDSKSIFFLLSQGQAAGDEVESVSGINHSDLKRSVIVRTQTRQSSKESYVLELKANTPVKQRIIRF
jgi:hypothetical protein